MKCLQNIKIPGEFRKYDATMGIKENNREKRRMA